MLKCLHLNLVYQTEMITQLHALKKVKVTHNTQRQMGGEGIAPTHL